MGRGVPQTRLFKYDLFIHLQFFSSTARVGTKKGLLLGIVASVRGGDTQFEECEIDFVVWSCCIEF